MLGGGGEYFIAWLLGFAHGLHAAGVSADLADVIVGTSAGAMVGNAVAADRLGFLRDDIDFFGPVPKLLADLIPTRASNPSQVRARDVAEATHDASVAAIQSIGRGAMCSTSTHVDLVAGAKRALVVALTDKSMRFSGIPNDIAQELNYVEASGTRTLLIAADPGKVHLLSAAEIEPALHAGHDRAVREADRIKAFWG